nr:hypothetical protein CFP56_11107 [Quercus suber]
MLDRHIQCYDYRISALLYFNCIPSLQSNDYAARCQGHHLGISLDIALTKNGHISVSGVSLNFTIGVTMNIVSQVGINGQELFVVALVSDISRASLDVPSPQYYSLLVTSGNVFVILTKTQTAGLRYRPRPKSGRSPPEHAYTQRT